MKYVNLSKIYYKDEEAYDMIYTSRIQSESAYVLPIDIHNNKAFFLTNLEMIQGIDSLYKSVSEINLKLVQLPSIVIESLITKSLKDEVMLTNEIEGITSTRKEIEDAIESQKSSKKSRYKGLITKYLKLINDDKVSLSTLSDIKNIYDELVLDEIDSEDKPDGTYFRKNPVSVVTATQKEKHKGVMPEEKINEQMTACLNMLENGDLIGIIKGAIFHYFFGYIHPYYDGNGRTSRFISSCILKEDLGILVSLRFSYVIKENIRKYYDAFDITNDFRNKGDMTYFILFFIELLNQASKDLNVKLNEAKDKLNFYSDKIKSFALLKNEKKIIFILCQDALYGDGGLGIKKLTEAMEMSETSVRKILFALSEHFPIHKRKIGHRDIFFINLHDIDLLSL